MSNRPRQRRSLTHIGGAIQTTGNAVEAEQLGHALAVASSRDEEGASRAHVHGFHTYPARMHPETAARLVNAFVPVRGRVLDPFCGSGTVLVEALVLGRNPFGTDLNPLAVRLARCKCRPRGRPELEQLVGRAKSCAAFAEDRRHARAGATRRFHHEDVRHFEPHVLLELDSLRARIESLNGQAAHLDLSLVLSAILVKLSKKRSDTSKAFTARRTSPGFASRLFVQKTEELARSLSQMSALVPSPWPSPAFIEQDDAAKLSALPLEKVDAVISSPPYVGTYDYSEHHDMRLRWLGLDAGALARGEMGSRSTYRKINPHKARDAWARELARFFQASARVMPANAPMVLIMADSAVGDVALRADEIVAQVALDCGFRRTATASQTRPHFHGPTSIAFRTRPRSEHAILLRRCDGQFGSEGTGKT